MFLQSPCLFQKGQTVYSTDIATLRSASWSLLELQQEADHVDIITPRPVVLPLLPPNTVSSSFFRDNRWDNVQQASRIEFIGPVKRRRR